VSEESLNEMYRALAGNNRERAEHAQLVEDAFTQGRRSLVEAESVGAATERGASHIQAAQAWFLMDIAASLREIAGIE
jgi:hypothetical protein